MAYIEFARPLQPSVMQGLKYIETGVTGNAHIKCYEDHKGYLMTDRYVQSDFRSPGCRVVSFMVEWLSSWSSVLESVEWITSRSTDR